MLYYTNFLELAISDLEQKGIEAEMVRLLTIAPVEHFVHHEIYHLALVSSCCITYCPLIDFWYKLANKKRPVEFVMF